MKFLFSVLILIAPAFTLAHPGGGLIAINEKTVVFGDSMYNSVWWLEKGKKPRAVIKNFHAHWTTRGLDGHIYSESFQEMGGAAFRLDAVGGKHVRVAEESHINAPVFAVGKLGEFIYQKDSLIMQRSANGTVTRFRGSGNVAGGEPALTTVIAFHWAADGTLYLSDDNNIRKVGPDGIIRLVARVEGKLLERQIWNSTGAPRVWSIATDGRNRIYAALPDIGQVVRIDPDGSRHVIDRYSGGWRVTAVATYADSVFLLESSDSNNDGQRVRVIHGTNAAEFLGQVEPS
jgi:hypothetical protein